jgi:hypothetical protein
VSSASRRRTWRGLAIVALASVSLLGQGERYQVDPRFSSPSATLHTYWRALQAGDAEAVWDCLAEMRDPMPVPGMLWFLPATDELTLEAFRSLPVTAGRVMVTYEVRFTPRGSSEERSFRTGDELVRERGEWRITRAAGEASMPDWESTPGPVDI